MLERGRAQQSESLATTKRNTTLHAATFRRGPDWCGKGCPGSVFAACRSGSCRGVRRGDESRAASVLRGAGWGLVAGTLAAVLIWIQGSVPLVLPFEPFEKPHWAVAIPAILVLAAANALGEECVWRSALQSSLADLPTVTQYALHAASFGLAHYSGLPGGICHTVTVGRSAAGRHAAPKTGRNHHPRSPPPRTSNLLAPGL